MDQSAMLSIVGGFYDKLVSDVADKVMAKLAQDNSVLERIEKWVTCLENKPAFNPAELAGELDYQRLADALAGQLDYAEIAGQLDYSEICSEIDYGSLISEIDLCDLASELDSESIASALDLSEKIREEIRMLLRNI